MGLLDESFESYLEDVDFGLALCGARYSADCMFPESFAGIMAVRPWAAGIRDSVRRMARNQVFLIAKHYPER